MKKIIFYLSTISNVLLGLMALVVIHSCEKENDNDNSANNCPSSIMGLWVGTYTADLLPNDPARYYSFVIKPDGALIVESHPVGNSPYLGTGTWTLNGSNLILNILYPNSPQGYSVSQTSTVVYDDKNDKLVSGIWINNGPPGGTGKFTMQKIK